jgi:HPt (histidine-containing phosphotransfer) domain-containing protein
MRADCYPQTQRPEPIKIVIPEGLANIVPEYLATRRAEVSEFMRLLAIFDYDRLAFMGHNLKGNGSSYGFQGLSRIGREIELAAKDQDDAALAAQMAQLCEYLSRVELVS